MRNISDELAIFVQEGAEYIKYLVATQSYDVAKYLVILAPIVTLWYYFFWRPFNYYRVLNISVSVTYFVHSYSVP